MYRRMIRRNDPRQGSQVTTPVRLSLSRLNHRLPRGQAHPEVVQGTTEFHHQIADTFFHKRIRSLTMRQRFTLLLTCSIRNRR